MATAVTQQGGGELRWLGGIEDIARASDLKHRPHHLGAPSTTVCSDGHDHDESYGGELICGDRSTATAGARLGGVCEQKEKERKQGSSPCGARQAVDGLVAAGVA